MHFCWQLCDICVFTVYACLWWYWRFFFFRQFNFDNIFCEEKRIQTSNNVVYSNSQLIFFFWITTNLGWNLLFRYGKKFYKMWNYVQPKRFWLEPPQNQITQIIIKKTLLLPEFLCYSSTNWNPHFGKFADRCM